jgi:hypothetical protein
MRPVIIGLVFYALIHCLEVSGYWKISLTSSFAFGMSFGMFIGWVWMDYWWKKSNDLLFKKMKELEHHDDYQS